MVKTIVYFRTSLSSIILQTIVLVALCFDIFACAVSTYALLKIWTREQCVLGILGMTIFYLGIPLILYIESTFLFGNIRLESNRVFNNGDKRFPKEKIQFRASVDYIDITSISIIPLNKNSKGESLFLLRPIPFLCLKTNNRSMRFSLHFMSSRTVRKLLLELSRRCKAVGNQISINVDSLLKDFLNSRLSITE